MTVSDIQKSRQFYGDLLGFEIQDIPPEYGNLVYFPAQGGTVWLLTHNQTPPGDRFSEFRVGLDHLSFVAPDEAALHALAARLIAAGVETNGIETYAPNGKRYVAFRDPDHIQLEYWLNA